MSLQNAATENLDIGALSPKFALRLFYIFALLALLSAGISIGGKWFGRLVALAGHTEDTTLHEVVLGNNVLMAPANAIRFERERRDGIATRLDLYLRWPDMQGYSAAARDDFNNIGGSRNILFLSFEPRMMSRDMSGRFAPIYKGLIEPVGRTGPGGSTVYAFAAKSGYLNEELFVADRGKGSEPFVARCLTGPAADESLAPCERDVHIGDELSLVYRFPRERLADWPALEAAVLGKAVGMLQAAR